MAQDTIPPADRIRELLVINADVAAMLQSAGQAINSLTDRPLDATEGDDAHMSDEKRITSVEERKEAFTENTKAYYTHLQAVVARLRRQAYALEEAGIIAPEPSSLGGLQQKQSVGQGGLNAQGMERITNGGLGNLDVGWLNSRGNKVGVDKESELLDEAKKLLEESLSAS